jgi:curved DNA-binding protein CbpA
MSDPIEIVKNDPWEVLGTHPDAGDEEIRQAYLQKVKAFPPEHAPVEFERIRDAYETLRDPKRRADLLLIGTDPQAPLISILEGITREDRRFVGTEPWLAVLKERKA